MLNVEAITTQSQFDELLKQIGFNAEPGDLVRLPVKEGTLSCCIFPLADQLLKPVAVTIEDSGFCVYFYNELNDWFNLYAQLGKNVLEMVLIDTIVNASKGATLLSA
jgi:hypothetical protein